MALNFLGDLLHSKILAMGTLFMGLKSPERVRIVPGLRMSGTLSTYLHGANRYDDNLKGCIILSISMLSKRTLQFFS